MIRMQPVSIALVPSADSGCSMCREQCITKEEKELLGERLPYTVVTIIVLGYVKI